MHPGSPKNGQPTRDAIGGLARGDRWREKHLPAVPEAGALQAIMVTILMAGFLDQDNVRLYPPLFGDRDGEPLVSANVRRDNFEARLVLPSLATRGAGGGRRPLP